MYKTAARQIHFKAQEGSSSVRVTQRGYAGKSLQGDPITILPTLKEQFEAIQARLAVLPALIDASTDFTETQNLQRELAAKNSQFFNLRKIIYQGCMIAKERIFMNVAKQRLPEDLYAKLLAEAHDYWAAEYQEFVAERNAQERQRASRKLQFRQWRDNKK